MNKSKNPAIGPFGNSRSVNPHSLEDRISFLVKKQTTQPPTQATSDVTVTYLATKKKTTPPPTQATASVPEAHSPTLQFVDPAFLFTMDLPDPTQKSPVLKVSPPNPNPTQEHPPQNRAATPTASQLQTTFPTRDDENEVVKA